MRVGGLGARRTGPGALVVSAIVALALSAPATAAKPKLSASDRAAISTLLDRFVVQAVARKDPAAAYDLATSDLREGMTRAEWRTGNIPVYPFTPRGTHFPWTLSAIVDGKLSIELLLQPQSNKAGALAYDLEVKKVGGRWLVDAVQPVAAFASPNGKASVAGPKDYQAGASQSTAGESRLSLIWLGLGVGALAVVIAGIVFYVVLRNMRRRRRIEAEFGGRSGKMPPLPGSR